MVHTTLSQVKHSKTQSKLVIQSEILRAQVKRQGALEALKILRAQVKGQGALETLEILRAQVKGQGAVEASKPQV